MSLPNTLFSVKINDLIMNKQDRYQTSHLNESLFEPGSGSRVLKNLLGIKRKRAMDQAEGETLRIATDRLIRTYAQDYCFKEEDIQKMHKLWLSDIYEWAGNYRNVNISKGGFPFATAEYVPKLMKEFHKDFLRKHTPCNFKTRDRIIQALAEVHTELVLIHPFREGNGRLARILATLMAIQAELPLLDFTDIKGPIQKKYYRAVQAGLDRNYEPMKEIFDLILDRSMKNY